jgi:hypothetical protein
MGDPRSLLPHEVEIFVTRELRKAGLAPSAMKVRDRELVAGRIDHYTVELGCSLRVGDDDRYVLIDCRNHPDPAGTPAIDALHTKVQRAKAHHAMMFSTTGFDVPAVRTAEALGMPLLAVADGKTAFARSSWGMAGDPPAWVPEYMAELVGLDASGQPRMELLAAGGSKRILDAFARNQGPGSDPQESGSDPQGPGSDP